MHHGFGCGVRSIELGGDSAFVHDEDPVGHAEHLGELRRDHQDRDAAPREVGEESVHLGLGAHVDAAGGLVDDEELRLGREPLGEHDLLLVAAREGRDRVLLRARLHLEALRPLRGGGAFAGAVDEAEPGQRVPQRQRRVAGDREVHDEPLLAPVLGHEADAGVDGGLRIPRTQRSAEQLDAAPVVAVDAEHGPRDLGAAGADESGEGDDLAGAHLEVDVAEHARAREPGDREHGVADLGLDLGEQLCDVAADHLAHDDRRS